jgi:hypothetical protein
VESYLCPNKYPLDFRVPCCQLGDTGADCTPSLSRKCSALLKSGPEFFSFCPLINQTSCGLPNSDNSTDMAIWASTETQTFKFDKLKRTGDTKSADTAVCIYQITAPPLQYKLDTLKLSLKLTIHEKDVRLYLQKGYNIQNQTGTLFGNSSNDYIVNSVNEKKEFELSGEESMILTAIPRSNGDMTGFGFEYKLQGEFYPWYQWYYYQIFVVPKNGRMFLIGGSTIFGILFCLFCACLYICISRHRNKHKVNNEIPIIVSTQNYQQSKAMQENKEIEN